MEPLNIQVVNIHWADIYRDGGSYGFVFEADDGAEYEFFVPIARIRPSADQRHDSPEIYRGSCNHDLVLRLSWEQAAVFVAPLRFDDDRFREMVSIVMRQGRKAA